MNKDNNYFLEEDKYPKLGLLNEGIVKDSYSDINKKPSNNYIQVELTDYQQLADDQIDYEKKNKKNCTKHNIFI